MVKWRNPGKGVAPSPTPCYSSYRKRNLQVTLDYGRQLYLLYYHWELFPPLLLGLEGVGMVQCTARKTGKNSCPENRSIHSKSFLAIAGR